MILEKMAKRTITSANYITSVNGMVHPDRIMAEHDFLYLLDGSWEIIEDGQKYELQTDDLLILSAGRHHYGEKLCNPGNRHMYFHVLPTAKEQQMEKVEDRNESENNDTYGSGALIHCQNDPRIRQYFQELIAAFWSLDEERENRLSLFFNLILCEIIRMNDAPMENRTDSMVEDIRKKIQSNPQIFYGAKEMADQYYICARTLNNHFKKVCQKTFSAYQMDLKLEMVRQFLIHQPETKLHEVALNFGFYDEFHLSKAFKKKFGQPPSRISRIMQTDEKIDEIYR